MALFYIYKCYEILVTVTISSIDGAFNVNFQSIKIVML